MTGSLEPFQRRLSPMKVNHPERRISRRTTPYSMVTRLIMHCPRHSAASRRRFQVRLSSPRRLSRHNAVSNISVLVFFVRDRLRRRDTTSFAPQYKREEKLRVTPPTIFTVQDTPPLSIVRVLLLRLETSGGENLVFVYCIH